MSADGSLDTSGMLPLWLFEIYHSEPGATNPWMRMVNGISEEAARNVAINLFVADMLNPITIYRILIYPIEEPEGGEGA